MYTEILSSNIEEMIFCCCYNKIILQFDNDPDHKTCILILLRNNIIIDWPNFSTDLNQIENILKKQGSLKKNHLIYEGNFN